MEFNQTKTLSFLLSVKVTNNKCMCKYHLSIKCQMSNNKCKDNQVLRRCLRWCHKYLLTTHGVLKCIPSSSSCQWCQWMQSNRWKCRLNRSFINSKCTWCNKTNTNLDNIYKVNLLRWLDMECFREVKWEWTLGVKCLSNIKCINNNLCHQNK